MSLMQNFKTLRPSFPTLIRPYYSQGSLIPQAADQIPEFIQSFGGMGWGHLCACQRSDTALMIRRNIVNILTFLRWLWAVYKRGILLLLLLLLLLLTALLDDPISVGPLTLLDDPISVGPLALLDDPISLGPLAIRPYYSQGSLIPQAADQIPEFIQSCE
eukprot:sb/3472892/